MNPRLVNKTLLITFIVCFFVSVVAMALGVSRPVIISADDAAKAAAEAIAEQVAA